EVLASNILPRQLWDLALGCFTCNRRSLVPSRPPGSPLGRNAVGPFPRTKLVVPAAPIELPSGAVYASARCVEARRSELRTLAMPLTTVPIQALESSQTLRDLMDRARAVFHSVLQSVLAREQTVGRRPQRQPHRLQFLVERVEASIASFPEAIDIPA